MSEVGHTPSSGFAASLRQEAEWIEKAVSGTAPFDECVELGDIDTDELRDAADHIDALQARVAELEAALHAVIQIDHHNHGPESRATKVARAAISGASS
jgi:hypothetical protein